MRRLGRGACDGFGGLRGLMVGGVGNLGWSGRLVRLGNPVVVGGDACSIWGLDLTGVHCLVVSLLPCVVLAVMGAVIQARGHGPRRKVRLRVLDFNQDDTTKCFLT